MNKSQDIRSKEGNPAQLCLLSTLIDFNVNFNLPIAKLTHVSLSQYSN